MTGSAVSIQHTSILLVNLNCDNLVLNFSKLLKNCSAIAVGVLPDLEKCRGSCITGCLNVKISQVNLTYSCLK